MESKCLKKSTTQQLQKLVEFMEDNPKFARGAPVFGANKFSVEEKWKTVCKTLNSNGPPTRTVVEWKKTWADLKSRTKKKIAENKKCLQETGGGLYRKHYLTELEQSIDRILLLSSAAAPSGRVFGASVANGNKLIDDCFQPLEETPSRTSKVVAVITPSRLEEKTNQPNNQSVEKPQDNTAYQTTFKRRPTYKEDDVQPACSSHKKRKSAVDEQLALIRRQLRVAEKNAASSAEQASAMNRLAAAAELQAESAKRMADAAEPQASCMRNITGAVKRIENKIEDYFLV